ncbi:MAG: hypothetical protein ACTSRP_26800 [Candidatus Helarchaeota archaeon]
MKHKIKKFVGIDANNMKPTKNHVPVIWECMLGTIFAVDGKVIRYVGYNYDLAKKYVLANCSDFRIWRYKQHNNSDIKPRYNQLVLWAILD